MYEENERRINWLVILKRVIVIIIVLIIIFGIITLVTKCTRKVENTKRTDEPTVNLKTQITEVQNATLDYITVETLPLNINQTKTIKLKYLINKNLINNLKDSNGNACDTDASYSEITRLENNYAMKTTLVCGKNKDYSVVYIGCFDSCKNGICIGNASDKNGICTINSDDKKTDNNSKEDNSKKSSDSKNNSSKTNKNTTTTTKSTTKGKILYEYKKPNYTYTCKNGSELVGNDCRRLETYTYIGKVKETYTPKTSVVSTNAKVESVTLTNPSYAVNSNSIRYELVSIKNGKYTYNKYSCENGTLNNYTCTYTQVTNEVVKSCADSSYTYNAKDNTCTLKKVVSIWSVPETKVTYSYTWSEKTSLPGWIRTGRVK